MKLHGNVWTFGDDIDTDLIIPARYLNESEPAALAAHCMEDADKEFINKIEGGDIITAGKNFGCGSSREHAPMAIRAAGISLVIAKSFARIFFRNAFNIGLPILECETAGEIREGHALSVDLDTGCITVETTGKVHKSKPIPPFMQKLVECGGLMAYVKVEYL